MYTRYARHEHISSHKHCHRNRHEGREMEKEWAGREMGMGRKGNYFKSLIETLFHVE